MYLDESSSEYPYVVSGWAATRASWDSISDSWNGVLQADPKLSYFKINDALGFKGPFKGWSELDRNAKLRALIKTIPHDRSIFGLGCHIRRDVFESMKDQIARKIYRDPYYYCVATTMIFSVIGEGQILGVDKIDFILDKSHSAERMRRLFYDDIKPRFPKLGECFTLDDKETLALQAADLNAGAIRCMYDTVPRIIPGIRLLDGLPCNIFEVAHKGLLEATATVFRSKGPKPDPSC